MLWRFNFFSSRVTGVGDYFLVRPFLSGKTNFLSIDHDYIIARINMLRKGSLMFSYEQYSDLARDPAKTLIFCINQPPIMDNCFVIGMLRLETKMVHNKKFM